MRHEDRKPLDVLNYTLSEAKVLSIRCQQIANQLLGSLPEPCSDKPDYKSSIVGQLLDIADETQGYIFRGLAALQRIQEAFDLEFGQAHPDVPVDEKRATLR